MERIGKRRPGHLSKCSPTPSAHKHVSVFVHLYQRHAPSVHSLALESPSLRPAHCPGLSCPPALLQSLRRCSTRIKSSYRSRIRIPSSLVTFPGRRPEMKFKGCFRNLGKSSMCEFVSWSITCLENLHRHPFLYACRNSRGWSSTRFRQRHV